MSAYRIQTSRHDRSMAPAKIMQWSSGYLADLFPHMHWIIIPDQSNKIHDQHFSKATWEPPVGRTSTWSKDQPKHGTHGWIPGPSVSLTLHILLSSACLLLRAKVADGAGTKVDLLSWISVLNESWQDSIEDSVTLSSELLGASPCAMLLLPGFGMGSAVWMGLDPTAGCLSLDATPTTGIVPQSARRTEK